MRKPRVAVGIAVLAIAVASCNGASQSDGDQAAFDPKTCRGGTLHVLNTEDFIHLDPARLYTSGGGNVPSLLFRSLTTRNRAPGAAGAEVVPDLATSTGETGDNGRTWTFELKDGVKFEDGTPITSKDIKYGIERSFAPELPGGPPYLRDWLENAGGYEGPYNDPAGIEAIETPNDKTIVFHLRRRQGEFPFLASATQFSPVPKDKDTGTEYEKALVSSGPYRIQRYEKNKLLVLVRNPHWSQAIDEERLACPDRIEIRSGLNPTVINQRLATSGGEDARAVTTDTTLGAAEIARLGSDPKLSARVAKSQLAYTYYLAFNPKVKPFDDPRVRQAISYAINRKSVVNAIGGNLLGSPATTFLPPQKSMGYRSYDHFPARETGDPEKARGLLTEAGYADGLTITLTHVTDVPDGTGPGAASAVQDALKRAGITVRLDGLDTASFYEKVKRPSSQPGFVTFGWGADWPSGLPFLQPIFDGRQILEQGNYNLGQYDDPAVNAEFDAIAKVTDADEATERVGKLDARLGKEALIIPLYHARDAALYGSEVQNVYQSEWSPRYDLSVISVK